MARGGREPFELLHEAIIDHIRAMASLSEEFGSGDDAQRQTQLPASRNTRFAASITRRWPLAVMPLYGRSAILPEAGGESR